MPRIDPRRPEAHLYRFCGDDGSRRVQSGKLSSLVATAMRDQDELWRYSICLRTGTRLQCKGIRDAAVRMGLVSY